MLHLYFILARASLMNMSIRPEVTYTRSSRRKMEPRRYLRPISMKTHIGKGGIKTTTYTQDGIAASVQTKFFNEEVIERDTSGNITRLMRQGEEKQLAYDSLGMLIEPNILSYDSLGNPQTEEGSSY